MSYRVIRAYTANRNTEFSDMQRFVPHVVEYEEDSVKKSVTISAECPIDAIEKLNTGLQLKHSRKENQ
jgi:hypothetical protein